MREPSAKCAGQSASPVSAVCSADPPMHQPRGSSLRPASLKRGHQPRRHTRMAERTIAGISPQAGTRAETLSAIECAAEQPDIKPTSIGVMFRHPRCPVSACLAPGPVERRERGTGRGTGSPSSKRQAFDNHPAAHELVECCRGATEPPSFGGDFFRRWSALIRTPLVNGRGGRTCSGHRIPN